MISTCMTQHCMHARMHAQPGCLGIRPVSAQRMHSSQNTRCGLKGHSLLCTLPGPCHVLATFKTSKWFMFLHVEVDAHHSQFLTKACISARCLVCFCSLVIRARSGVQACRIGHHRLWPSVQPLPSSSYFSWACVSTRLHGNPLRPVVGAWRLP